MDPNRAITLAFKAQSPHHTVGDIGPVGETTRGRSGLTDDPIESITAVMNDRQDYSRKNPS
jgi:hypothetical protein